MRSFAYPATVTKDEASFYLVTFPDVPEAGTDDPDRATALAEAVDALACALEGYIEARRPLPAPSPLQEGQALVVLPPLMAAKAALYLAMVESGTSNVTLARQLGTAENAVRRLLNLRHRSHIGEVDRALAALGRRLVVAVERAA